MAGGTATPEPERKKKKGKKEGGGGGGRVMRGSRKYLGLKSLTKSARLGGSSASEMLSPASQAKLNRANNDTDERQQERARDGGNLRIAGRRPARPASRRVHCATGLRLFGRKALCCAKSRRFGV